MAFPKDQDRFIMEPSAGQTFVNDAGTNFLQNAANFVDKYAGGKGTRQLLSSLGDAKDKITSDIANTQRIGKDKVLPNINNLSENQVNDTILDPVSNQSKSLADMNQPGGFIRMESGPRAGMTFTSPAKGGKIQAYDSQGNLTKLPYSDEIRTGDVNRLSGNINNLSELQEPNRSDYDVDFAPGTSQEEQDAFMQTPLSGGTRMRSNLPGKDIRLGLNQQPTDERKTKLWEIATTSKFPKRRQAAIRGLELLDKDQQFDTTLTESQQQFDIQEERLSGRDELLGRQSTERLDIDRQRAETDAAYKKALTNKQVSGSSLNKNQWITQDRTYSNDYQKRFNPANDAGFATDPKNFFGESNQMDHRTLLHRDNPQAATEIYGQPDSQMKAILDFNMNPEQWAAYNAASPEQKQKMIANHIARRKY